MSIGDRLRSLHSSASTAPIQRWASSEGSALRAWAPQFERALGGQWQATPRGDCAVVAWECSADERHGERRLGDTLEVPADGLAWLAREPAESGLDLGTVAFLDCETTGLAGGTGTHAFLVGVGRVSGEQVHVKQFFMPDYSDEPAFLAAIDEHVRQFAAIATFNGRAFDLPLLETRFALARQDAEWLDLPHLDLLHPARRLWRRRLESCALTSLEQNVLGFRRAGDVPGWLIPTLYFDFLRNRNLSPLLAVFEHNRHDLLALVALVARMARLVSGAEHPEHGLDLYSLGLVMEDRGDDERSAACYERALASTLLPDQREEVQTRLGLLYKRLRQTDRALEVWRAVVRSLGDRSVFALVEMAKHHEHRLRDYETAADLTRRAIRAHGLTRDPFDPRWREQAEALEHRLRRLEERLRRRA